VVFYVRSMLMAAHATMHTATEEQCFLRGPYRGVINRTSVEFSVVGYLSAGKDISRGHC
jgi:hypothetical protein